MPVLTDSVAACFPQPAASEFSGLPLHRRDEDDTTAVSRDNRREMRAFSWTRLVRAYWSDWALILLLWFILAILNRSGGHKREFSLKDISIQHSFAVIERVPSLSLAIISFGVPLAFLLPISSFVARNAWDVHNAVAGLGMSWTMAGVVTQIIKMMVGRPRPDLIARCMPRAGAEDHPVFGLSTVEICTSTDLLILNDGFKSFPSGHSSLSFAGLGFLTLYLAGKMHLWDRYGNRNRAWFALCPLLLAAMVAISRTMDNRHHWQDVLVGSALGFCVALVAYRTYYPPLDHRKCHLPLLPPPASGEEQNEIEEAGDSALRLFPDESGIPRPSEEESAWRN